MFNSITWEIFLSTIIFILFGYYAILTLLLYHKEIKQWFKSSSQNPLVSTLPASPGVTKSGGIMGRVNDEKSLAEQRSSTLSSEDFLVGDAEDDEPEMIIAANSASSTASKDNLLIGSVADLLQEIKTLIHLIAEYQTEKTESESLFQTLLIRYPHLRGTNYQQTISLYICEVSKSQFAFDVELEEVMDWWKEEAPTKK